jgi:dUTP pyrophosphatase
MKEEIIQVPFTGEGQAPKRASEWAAGADLHAGADVTLAPGERALVPTGLQLAIPAGHVGLVWPRSGLAVRHGIDTLAGVIDSDYRGEVRVLLVNHGAEPFQIRCGDRIAQLLIQRVEQAEFIPVVELPPSVRGEGGFGSTGA